MDVSMMMMTGENLVGESDKQTDDFASDGSNAKKSNFPLEEEELVTSTIQEQEQEHETTSLTAQMPIDWRLLPPLPAPRDVAHTSAWQVHQEALGLL
jgi:hypothetical protein